MTDDRARRAIEAVFRIERPALIARLARMLRDLLTTDSCNHRLMFKRLESRCSYAAQCRDILVTHDAASGRCDGIIDGVP